MRGAMESPDNGFSMGVASSVLLKGMFVTYNTCKRCVAGCLSPTCDSTLFLLKLKTFRSCPCCRKIWMK